MKYVGMYSQIRRNNTLSFLLLLAFPFIILLAVWGFIALFSSFQNSYTDSLGESHWVLDVASVNEQMLVALPWVFGIVGLWFVIAYFSNETIIRKATGAHALQRRDNPRVYNIVENLCMACNMDMPKINIIDDDQLNAFASGINKGSYTVTLTTGIINYLDDAELEGVIAHELTHIRNHDTRLLITCIVFVGIVSTIMTTMWQLLYYNLLFGSPSSYDDDDGDSNNKSKGGLIVIFFIGFICASIAYFFTIITRFAISRKREYMADAGGAELSGNPMALASALRKISNHPGLADVGRDDIAQLYIVHPFHKQGGISRFISSLFSTHPDTQKRIEILEQF